jgi:hypothetical protein
MNLADAVKCHAASSARKIVAKLRPKNYWRKKRFFVGMIS